MVMYTGSLTILCVDDDPGFVDLTATFLEEKGDRFTVITETSASDGLDHLAEENIDCIVSDYEMPEMDGLDFLHAVRDEYPDLPFILFTGKGSEDIAEEAIQAGVSCYLQKESGTSHYTVLANRIEQSVSQYRAHRRASSLEQEYQLVAETATDAFWVVDLLTDTVSMSEGLEQFGYDSNTDFDREWFFEQVHPDDREEMREYSEAAITRQEWVFDELTSDRGEFSNTFRFQRANGTYAHCEGRAIAVFEDGEPLKMVGTITDVTDRNQREQELEQTRDRMHQTLEATGSKLWELNPETGSATLYPTSSTLLGTTIESLDDALQQIHPEDRQQVTDAIETVLETGEPSTCKYRVERDGEVRWLESRGHVIQDDSTEPATQVRGVTQDITERVQTEQELKETTQQLEAVLETVPAGVFMWDTDRRAILQNQYVRERLGLEDEQVQGQTMTELLPADLAEQAEWHLQQALTAGETIQVEEQVPLGEEVRTFETYYAPMYDEDGEAYAVCGVATDITERKDYEQDLERKTERLDKFASVLSHDLRSPLSIAQGRLELAQEECDTPHINEVKSAVSRVESIIDNVLAVAREGDSIDKPEDVPLRAVAEGAWRGIGDESATLIVEKLPTSVAGDRERVRRLFENLFRNAVEHGGDDVTVRVGSLDDERGFYVEDDGSGFAEADVDQLFEWGYSMDGEGTGFGLAIVERIVEAHEWTITAMTSDNGGARFEIRGIQSV